MSEDETDAYIQRCREAFYRAYVIPAEIKAMKAFDEIGYDLTYIHDRDGRIVDAMVTKRVEKHGIVKRSLDYIRQLMS